MKCVYDYPEETEIIDFHEISDKGAFGRAADGIIVFPDNDAGIHINVGETWICRLRRHSSSDKQIYWAWPIEKTIIQTEIMTNNDTCEQGSSIDEIYKGDGRIQAIGNDTIFSEIFTNERYYAYRSLDGTCMQLIVDHRGDIICKDNMMSIEDVDSFITDAFPVNLDFINMNNGFLIRLSGGCTN